MFWALDYVCLALIVAAARDRRRAAEPERRGDGAVGARARCMSVLFVVLGAPDDAHSEVVVGAIALPVLYLVAIGKSRGDVPDRGELGEYEDQDERR